MSTGYNLFRSLSDFVGTKVTRGLSMSHGSEEDKLKRKEWLPQFLAGNGLGKLIDLLRKLFRVQASIEESKKQQILASIRRSGAGAGDITIKINERILKRCLREVMECVRILLISQMCAVTQDQHMALSLSRKLSSTNKQVADVEMAHQEGESEGQSGSAESKAKHQAGEDEIDSSANQGAAEKDDAGKGKGKGADAKKPKLLQEKEHTEEEMKPLIELIKSRIDLQMDFTTALELESFQKEILGIITAFMDKRDIRAEDSEIVNQGLSIWLSCLASDPKLLNVVYRCVENDMALDIQKKGPIAYFMEIFINRGLVSSDEKLREAFMSAIRFITQSIKSKELPQSPLHFFLRLLVSKLDVVGKRQISKETRHYFIVVREALHFYFEEQAKAQRSPLKEALAPQSQLIFDNK